MMTKQEEIREGIAELDKLCPLGNGGECPPDNAKCKKCAYKFQTADVILSYLHSKDVAIKVAESLPSAFDIDDEVISAIEYKKKLVGYSLTEPLIKEVI